MIKARGITRKYGELQVLKGIDLDIGKGEIISIVGESGAGKTTLLQILGTLDRPDTGNILYGDTDVSKMNQNSLADFRNRHIGFIFQFHQLLPEFTCLENVCMPAFIAGISRSEAENKALDLLNYLGLSERQNHKPSELSGGEQQRCAVARALMNNPSVVYADEPSGNLDSRNAAELHKLFLSLRADFGCSFVIVTHNEELAAMADRKLVMKDGIILT